MESLERAPSDAEANEIRAASEIPVLLGRSLSNLLGAPGDKSKSELQNAFTDVTVRDEPTPSTAPACLKPVVAGITNRTTPPTQWSLTVEQWQQFLVVCKVAKPKLWRQRLAARGYVNLYDLNEHFVTPWTLGTGSGIALRMNADRPLDAELMVSHAWAEDIEECCQALRKVCKACGADGHREVMPCTKIWFCLYAQYQAGGFPEDPGPTLKEQLAMEPFATVIDAVNERQGMLVVHTSAAEVYDRLWCVYEISEALQKQTETRPACSEKYLVSARGKLLDVLKVKTAHAKCSEAQDTLILQGRIRKAGGFKRLDEIIFNFRMKMLRELYQERLQGLEMPHNCDFFRNMATEFIEAERHIREKKRKRKAKMLVFGLGWSGIMLLLLAGVALLIWGAANTSFDDEFSSPATTSVAPAMPPSLSASTTTVHDGGAGLLPTTTAASDSTSTGGGMSTTSGAGFTVLPYKPTVAPTTTPGDGDASASTTSPGPEGPWPTSDQPGPPPPPAFDTPVPVPTPAPPDWPVPPPPPVTPTQPPDQPVPPPFPTTQPDQPVPPPPFSTTRPDQPAPPPFPTMQPDQPAPPPPFSTTQPDQPAPPPFPTMQPDQPAPPPPFSTTQPDQPAPPPSPTTQPDQPVPPPPFPTTTPDQPQSTTPPAHVIAPTLPPDQPVLTTSTSAPTESATTPRPSSSSVPADHKLPRLRWRQQSQRACWARRWGQRQPLQGEQDQARCAHRHGASVRPSDLRGCPECRNRLLDAATDSTRQGCRSDCGR
eukprot:TRINITY_DN1547_c0_g1_i1.p1 TRINITY_DN1547_c0_g1~~TRINITY_DN1547_c0_g1_i1.p1  ORF type:complete len:768 (-),score=124.15 TRINITY_DN1547_c0_g1_i1:208-2511(-)